MMSHRFPPLIHHILKEKTMGFLNGSNGHGPEPEDDGLDWDAPYSEWPLWQWVLFLVPWLIVLGLIFVLMRAGG